MQIWSANFIEFEKITCKMIHLTNLQYVSDHTICSRPYFSIQLWFVIWNAGQNYPSAAGFRTVWPFRWWGVTFEIILYFKKSSKSSKWGNIFRKFEWENFIIVNFSEILEKLESLSFIVIKNPFELLEKSFASFLSFTETVLEFLFDDRPI